MDFEDDGDVNMRKKRRRYGVSTAQTSRLIGAVRKYALECLEYEDLDSLYAFCEQFAEIMQNVEAGHEAAMQDYLAGLNF